MLSRFVIAIRYRDFDWRVTQSGNLVIPKVK
jgi:hypothetical protein